jgi:type II secretory pathway component GspD/PulD (secretin)
LIAASSIYAQTPAKMLPLVAEVEVMTAFVVDVDLQNRTIELKDTSGNLYQMKVSKQVNDLDKVKKSDVFVVESAQSIAVGLVAAPKGQKPGVSSARSVTVSAKGSAKPFEEITDTVFATLKINTIDSKKRTVTFIWPSGERQKVKVDKSVLGLENFKAGDDVMIEFVDDTIIAFTAPAKTKK